MLDLALAGRGRGLDGRSRPARRRRRAHRRGHPRALIPTSPSPSMPAGAISSPARRRCRTATRRERARAAFDLVILSVLLDAGAGPGWRYRRSGRAARPSPAPKAWRSPASACSRPARLDDLRRRCETRDAGARASRSRTDNPLVGLDGRAALLRRLGAQVLARPDLFAGRARPAGSTTCSPRARRAGGCRRRRSSSCCSRRSARSGRTGW